MPRVKSEAIVLRKTDYSESSLVLVLLTREAGKVHAIAKGAKRKRGLWAGVPDVLNACRVVVLTKPGGALAVLTECEILDTFPALRGELGRHYASMYVAELADGFCREGKAEPETYALVRGALRALCGAADLRLAVAAFELKLLAAAGVGPELDACVLCRSALGPGCAFGPLEGGAVCARCVRGREIVPSTPGGLALARGLRRVGMERAQRIRSSPGTLSELRGVLDAYVTAVLERRPRTRRYIRAVLGGRLEHDNVRLRRSGPLSPEGRGPG